MVSTVDGLISGLSTADLITSLMKVEAAPQDSLKAKVDVQGQKTTSFQALNAKLAGLKAATDALTTLNAFKTVKTTSSSSTVAASAVPGSATGQLTFDVTKLAVANVMTVSVPSSGDFADGSGVQLTNSAGVATPVTVTTNTPQGVADAINAANVGVKAAVITTDTGDRLQLTSTKTGTDNAFTLSGVNGDQNTITAASNAQVTVGDPATTGYTVTNQSNTFTGLIQGVAITVSKVETGVTIGATNSPTSWTR
jgi:flagellar hook-associated protein 2